MKLIATFAALVALAATALLATTSQAIVEEVEVALDELNGSGVTGSASVAAAGDGQSELNVSIIGADPDSSHVNHIHDGTGCGQGEYSGIVETLTNIDADASGEGAANTMVGLDFETVADGNHVIVVHAGATLEEDATPIACGSIPVASITAPPPAGTGYVPGDGAARLSLAIGAVVAAGLALLGAGWTLRRRAPHA